jgi:hypothetical protein
VHYGPDLKAERELLQEDVGFAKRFFVVDVLDLGFQLVIQV